MPQQWCWCSNHRYPRRDGSFAWMVSCALLPLVWLQAATCGAPRIKLLLSAEQELPQGAGSVHHHALVTAMCKVMSARAVHQPSPVP